MKMNVVFALMLGVASGLEVQAAENPIRRIVNLLQSTQKKIEEEGEKMEDMFEKFMCYCDTNVGKLEKSISDLNDEIPQIEASVKGLTELKAQLDEELKQHKTDRSDANGAIDAATEQRNKDKAAFDAYSVEAKANLAACKKAEGAIRKGMGESFLQSSDARMLQQVVTASKHLSDFDSQEITSFLEGKMEGSGEIVGILSQMAEDMAADLKDADESEAGAVGDFEGLVGAKEKEIAAATTAIEDKTERVGKAAVDIVNSKNDLADAQEALADDTGFVAELKKSCKGQGALFDTIKKTRSEELAAIGATIKILNDDDALDLFKKALPSSGGSFLQVGAQTSSRARARVLLKAAEEAGVRGMGKGTSSALTFQFMQLALSGKKAGFEKITKMMDEFVVTLKKEQKDDDEQKAYCEKEFEKSDDEKNGLERKIKTLTTQIEETTEAIAQLKDGIASLEQGIKDLDKSVAEATETRKEESTEYTETKAGNNAAKQLLEVAKNQLNKFYNPKTYKAPPKRELTEEERLYVASGGVLTTPPPGGIAGTGISFAQTSMSSRAAPPPPPMAIEAYKKQDSSGPVAMMDNFISDLKLEMQEDDMEEKAAQADYEDLMQESATKRATDAKTIVEKEGQLADAEERPGKGKKDKKAEQKELLALGEYIAGLHASCDFLVQNYDLRKEARTSEIESIQKAKAVLNGADYDAFVQMETHTTRFLHNHESDKCVDDEKRRVQLLQSLTVLQKDVNEACVEMCKQLGAYPDCNCPSFEPPDATPGVVTWDELYAMFDGLKDSGREMLKKYHKVA